MYELCRHIMPSNKTCGSPAVKEKLFCHNHQRVHDLTRTRRRNPNDFTYVIPFVFPEDRAAINYNLFLVNKALAEGRIDTRTANAMTSNLRVAAINLNRGPLLEQDPKQTVQRVILTPDGEEIAPPREALDPGESPLHYKNCPCRRCAEQFRGAAPEQHHADCQCGLCDEPAVSRPSHEDGCPISRRDVGAENLDQPGPQLLTNGRHPERTGVPDMRDVRVTGWRSEEPAVSSPKGPAVCEPATDMGAPSLEPQATRVGENESMLTEGSEEARSNLCPL